MSLFYQRTFTTAVRVCVSEMVAIEYSANSAPIITWPVALW